MAVYIQGGAMEWIKTNSLKSRTVKALLVYKIFVFSCLMDLGYKITQDQVTNDFT
jgi:hypothetical protein